MFRSEDRSRRLHERCPECVEGFEDLAIAPGGLSPPSRGGTQDTTEEGGPALGRRLPLRAEPVELVLAVAGLAPLGHEGLLAALEAELDGVGREGRGQLYRLLQPDRREQDLGEVLLLLEGEAELRQELGRFDPALQVDPARDEPQGLERLAAPDGEAELDDQGREELFLPAVLVPIVWEQVFLLGHAVHVVDQRPTRDVGR